MTSFEMNGLQDISWEAYREAPGVNKSSLDWIAPPYTPAHFHARFIAKTLVDEETPALRMGQLTHRVILQPDTLKDAFYIKPDDMNFSTKEGKAWRAEHPDRSIITAEEARHIEAMRDAVWRHPLAKRLLAGGEMERSLFATDKDGILRKARLDALTAGTIVPDLKTVLSTDERWFERQNSACRWFVQGAFTVDLCNLLGIEKVDFVCVCVEKTPPYDVVCRSSMEADTLRVGRMCYQRDLALLNECRAKDSWPGRSTNFEPAGLPAWEMKQLENL